MKMQRTIVIRRDYLHYIRKYNRFEKRHKNMSVHLSPCFRDVTVGDIVTVGECRPLSKTVRFNVLKELALSRQRGAGALPHQTSGTGRPPGLSQRRLCTVKGRLKAGFLGGDIGQVDSSKGLVGPEDDVGRM
ncbi:hypothetical protein QTP70_026496 [Hemibagrus guttatus]|uniref:Small ribosomal subunit protein uS17 n=1 Tax=Hemibagrus guttatus TaxID=175788 RepID=A0AAE0QHB2_9TELE|nr:hypothetical protein QTP70_026496 [Hemibagrus guttatus]